MQVWQQFLSEKERVQLVNESANFKQYAKSIHGEKRTMCKIKYHMHLLTVDIVSKCKNQFKGDETEIDFDRLHDCSIIWTGSDVAEQVWHMDALKRFAVVNIILNSDVPTEFLDLEYKRKDQGISSTTFDYPLKWVSSKQDEETKTIAPKIEAGDAIFFWSQTIHRGPANPASKKERISLYMTFPLKKQLKITTDYAFPNYAWFDSHFQCTKNHYHSDNYNEIRCLKQIDFIIKNEFLLDLYPHDWHGTNIYKAVKQQVDKRKAYIANFPSCANLWLVFWQTGQVYLTTVDFSIDNQKVKIHYLPTKKIPKPTIETVDTKTWELALKKIEIDLENVHEYNGYSPVPKENFLKLQTPCLLYPFSHLCTIECSPVIPLQIKETGTIYVHPDLLIQ